MRRERRDRGRGKEIERGEEIEIEKEKREEKRRVNNISRCLVLGFLFSLTTQVEDEREVRDIVRGEISIRQKICEVIGNHQRRNLLNDPKGIGEKRRARSELDRSIREREREKKYGIL